MEGQEREGEEVVDEERILDQTRAYENGEEGEKGKRLRLTYTNIDGLI